MTRSLQGKTLVITGASRGIGLAIAKRAAADGANIVILAKTTEPNPKLPGTLFSAAEEIEAAGGMSVAYQSETGIAGYTLIYEGLSPFKGANFDEEQGRFRIMSSGGGS